MPRIARVDLGGMIQHALGRGNNRNTVFHDRLDYEIMIRLMLRATEAVPMRILAWCLKPNHYHFVLWPHEDGDMGRWLHRLLTSHARRHHLRRGTSGSLWGAVTSPSRSSRAGPNCRSCSTSRGMRSRQPSFPEPRTGAGRAFGNGFTETSLQS